MRRIFFVDIDLKIFRKSSAPAMSNAVKKIIPIKTSGSKRFSIKNSTALTSNSRWNFHKNKLSDTNIIENKITNSRCKNFFSGFFFGTEKFIANITAKFNIAAKIKYFTYRKKSLLPTNAWKIIGKSKIVSKKKNAPSCLTALKILSKYFCISFTLSLLSPM